MEKYKFIYLTGFIAMLISLGCLLLWAITQSSGFANLGFGLSFVSTFIVFWGGYYGYRFYNDPKASTHTRQQRRRHFIGHTLTLSLGLALSWVNFTTFKVYSMPKAYQEVVVKVSNTSDRPVKNLSFQLGSQKYRIESLAPRKNQEFRLKPAGNTHFSSVLHEENFQREASIAVGEDNRFILLRVDYQHNLLPEVQ